MSSASSPDGDERQEDDEQCGARLWHARVGRRVTVVLNGRTIIDDAEIPGITGGALDSDERAAGLLMVQGDHGKVAFRKVVITPGE